MAEAAVITVGVLALQGAFSEHIQLLQKAVVGLESPEPLTFTLVKTPSELARCSALIIPGGESTTMALIAERSNLLEPLRDFVKVDRRPTWGTCAGMILLSEAANRTKKGGQSLIGGLSVRVNRNHFGRQVESFEAPLQLSFLPEDAPLFNGVFIRAPVVECILPREELDDDVEVRAPSKAARGDVESAFADDGRVEVIAELRRSRGVLGPTDRPPRVDETARGREHDGDASSIVAVRQGNVVGTSFHPELTSDPRMHRWWLGEVLKDLKKRQELLKTAGRARESCIAKGGGGGGAEESA